MSCLAGVILTYTRSHIVCCDLSIHCAIMDIVCLIYLIKENEVKKVLLPLFSFLLVLGLLGASFSSAKAEIGDDPVVTPVSGDMEFTTEVVPVAFTCPVLRCSKAKCLFPVGFPIGEAQFEGAGVRVTGMDYGKATACFRCLPCYAIWLGR